jgi:hypothetical protein
VNIQPDRPHDDPPSSRSTGREKQRANDTDESALEAQPDESQGRPRKKPGLNTPIAQTGLPNMPF